MQSPKELALDRLEALARKGVLHLRSCHNNMCIEWHGIPGTFSETGDNLAEMVFSLAKAVSAKEKK